MNLLEKSNLKTSNCGKNNKENGAYNNKFNNGESLEI